MDNIDKSWMKAHRLSPEYMKGVDQFLDYAFCNSTRNDNKIKCPCVNCNNVFLKVREEVKYDLCKKGIVSSYTTWYYHGEKEIVVVLDDEESDRDDTVAVVVERLGMPNINNRVRDELSNDDEPKEEEYRNRASVSQLQAEDDEVTNNSFAQVLTIDIASNTVGSTSRRRRTRGDFIAFMATRQIKTRAIISQSRVEDNEVMSNPSSQALPADTASSAGSTSGKKRTRGKTRNLDLIRLPPGQKLHLDFNEHGQPIGVNATKFSSYLGNRIRNDGDIPISLLEWDKVSDDRKEKIYKRLLDKFEFEETALRKQRIMQKMAKKFSDHKYHLKQKYYDKYETTEERLKHFPEGINADDWKVFVQWHDRESTKEMCEQNKSNRAKQVLPHYTGSKSYAAIRAEEIEKDPEHQNLSSWKMFCIAHTKNNGSASSTAAREIIDKFKTLSAQASKSSTPIEEDEIYRQVVGHERHGRTRGYGLGPTPSTVFGTSHGRGKLVSQLQVTNTHDAELRLKINELEKKIEHDRKKMEEKMEEDRRKMEEERKKMEEKMEEDRRKMDMLIAFMEEMRSEKKRNGLHGK